MEHFRQPAAISLIILFSLQMGGCGERAEQGKLSFTIRGRLENNHADRIFLSGLSHDKFVVQDTAPINGANEFVFSGKIRQPDIFRLSLSDTNNMMLVIDGPALVVTADAADLQSTVTVEGSDESALLKEWLAEERRSEEAAADLEQQFDRARAAGLTDSLGFLQERYIALEDDRETRRKDFIRRHPRSFVATYAAYRMMRDGADANFVDSMLVSFNASLPQSKYVALLKGASEKSHSLEVGSVAPEISLPQPDGAALSLSSLRGRYVLIDFWASWCRPCRQENPVMVKLYEQYHDRGFEILGVSLDESRERWVEAIEADRLPWRHVSDLRGAGSPVVGVYQVQAVPMTVLVDPEGRIAALNLRGERLEEKLAEVIAAVKDRGANE